MSFLIKFRNKLLGLNHVLFLKKIEYLRVFSVLRKLSNTVLGLNNAVF